MTCKRTEEEKEIFNQRRLEYNRPSFKKMLSESLPHECHVCGCTEESKLVYHHIVPLALGGENDLRNIIVLCAECHSKTHMVPNAWKEGGKGRPIKEFPDGYENILDDYVNGDIGRKECEKRLKIPRNAKLAECGAYKKYLADRKIDSVRNYVDLNTCKGRKLDGKRISIITFTDGTVKEIYNTGHNYKKIIFKRAI